MELFDTHFVYIGQVLAVPLETIQGQTFAINELGLWWHRILHWLN